MKNFIGPIGGLLAIVSIVIGSYIYFEDRYAKCAELKQLEQRLDYKIADDQYKSIQDRIWQIEDRFKNKPMDQTTTEELRRLKEVKESLKGKLTIMEKK